MESLNIETRSNLGVEKYVICLKESEEHPSGWCYRHHHIMTIWIGTFFKVLAKFQSRVNHRSNPKHCQ